MWSGGCQRKIGRFRPCRGQAVDRIERLPAHFQRSLFYSILKPHAKAVGLIAYAPSALQKGLGREVQRKIWMLFACSIGGQKASWRTPLLGALFADWFEISLVLG